MKIKSIAGLLIAFVLLSNAHMALAQLGGPGKVSGKVLEFDKEKFAATLKDRLAKDDPLIGYAAVIIKGGRIVAETAGGKAVRQDWNGYKEADMTTSTPNDLGSCMKLISFISLLSVFEKKAAKIGGSSIESYLDQAIYPYLPKQWRNTIDNPPDDKKAEALATTRVGKVTFRQLLQHKSGFRANVTKTTFAYIDTGIEAENIGVRDYENVNATLLTYLWPRLVDPASADKFDKQITDDISPSDTMTYGKLYGGFFENWMQANIFDTITPRIQPSCNPGVDYPKRNPPVPFALNYDGNKPIYGKAKQDLGGCHAMGGYYMSMRQLAAFMANFQASNVLVSEKIRKLMYDDSTEKTQDDRLGWSRILQSPFATKYFGVNAIPYHGGDKYGHTAIVQLPGGYMAVGTITGKKGSGEVATALKDAWGDALRANFEE